LKQDELTYNIKLNCDQKVPNLLKKKKALVALALLIIIVAASALAYLLSQGGYNGNLENVTVGFFNSEFNGLIYIAQDQHFFEANGLNITVKNYNTGAAALEGLLKGEVEITGASEFVVASKALESASIYTFGSYCKSDKYFVIGRSDRGIDEISNLKGKTIGAPMGTNGEFYIGRFLELNGIGLSEVNLVNVSPFVQTPAMLANGTVDAAVAFQPYINEVNALLDNKTVMWPIQAGQLSYIDAICTKSLAKENPDLIRRFLEALVEAESFTMTHEDEAIAIVANTLNYSVDYLSMVWSDYQFSISLDQSQIVAMEDQAAWMIENKLTNSTTIPNFLNYVYVDGLKAVKPESVNIIGLR
jgi:ABC-type nitrate/sulfonate/bicarbonate transport system substrate-binding protein